MNSNSRLVTGNTACPDPLFEISMDASWDGRSSGNIAYLKDREWVDYISHVFRPIRKPLATAKNYTPPMVGLPPRESTNKRGRRVLTVGGRAGALPTNISGSKWPSDISEAYEPHADPYRYWPDVRHLGQYESSILSGTVGEL